MAVSNGNCFICGKTAGKIAIKNHVLKDHNVGAESSGDSEACYLLKAEGAQGNNPTQYSMDIYKNPNCKKVRGSHILEVSCAYCRCFIANYQKVGESNFVKMYNDRIIDGSVDFSQYHGAIFCPNCGERIATRYITKMDKKEAYRLVPSAFHKKKI